jgi:hypothetical protein
MTDRRFFAAAMLASSALLYAVVITGLWRLPPVLWGMYANADGQWAAWNARAIMNWGVPFDLSPFNPLSGTGSLFLPNLPWANPAAMALAIPGPREIGYGLSYTIYFLELLVANYVLFRALGAARWPSFLAAQAFVLVLFPPTSIAFNGLPWYSLAPVNAHLLALCNAAVVLLLHIGRHDARRNLALGAAFVAVAFVGLFSAPLTIVTYVPAYALLFVVVVLVRPPPRGELAWKLGALVYLAAIFLATGVLDFLQTTGAVSSRIASAPPLFHRGLDHLRPEFISGLLSVFDVCKNAEFLYLACYRQPMGWVLAFAMLGSVVLVWRRQELRAVGVFVLLFVPLIHLFHLASGDFVFGPLHAISAPFLLWAAYPPVILAAVAGLAALVDPARLAPRLRAAAAVVGFVLVPAAALMLWLQLVRPSQPPLPGERLAGLALPRSNLRPEPSGPILTRLRSEAAIGVGSGFRGYAGTYLGDPRGWVHERVRVHPNRRYVGFYPATRLYLDRIFRTTFQEMDLWEAGIPTIEEYGQWVTVFMWVTALELLTPAESRVHPSFTRIQQLDLAVLRLLGLRFLISDVDLDEPGVTRIEREQPAGAPGPIFLYRVDGPGIGATPISQVEVAGRFEDAVRRLPALDAGTIVTFEPVAAPLAAPLALDFRYRRDGFAVRARASGPAGVVLPIQFSRCLRIVARGPGHRAGSVRLIRANAVQTLLAFDGDVDVLVRFDFGLLGAASCRRQDAEDVRALGLDDAARGRGAM